MMRSPALTVSTVCRPALSTSSSWPLSIGTYCSQVLPQRMTSARKSSAPYGGGRGTRAAASAVFEGRLEQVLELLLALLLQEQLWTPSVPAIPTLANASNIANSGHNTYLFLGPLPHADGAVVAGRDDEVAEAAHSERPNLAVVALQLHNRLKLYVTRATHRVRAACRAHVGTLGQPIPSSQAVTRNPYSQPYPCPDLDPHPGPDPPDRPCRRPST